MRKLATAAAVSLALASGGAFGLGLGDIEMRSALNQPMEAEIRLTAVQPGELNGMTVQLASPDAFARAGIDRAPVLTELSFRVDSSGSVPVIRISSRTPVVEPFLNFLLEVDWPQGRMIREYTVLLDPPVFMTPSATSRNSASDQPALVQQGDEALVIPTPIQRDDELVELEVLNPPALDNADGELVSLDSLADVAGELVSLESLGGQQIDDFDGEIVSLTDLAAPNTDAIQQRETFSSGTVENFEGFEIEVLGDTNEVSNSNPGYLGGSDGSTVVSLGDSVSVQRGDTLYEIAQSNAVGGASIQQMMLALLKANDSAFINGNINLVRAGAELRIPTASEANAISQAQAVASVNEQNQLWRDYRDSLRGSSPTLLATGTDSTFGLSTESTFGTEEPVASVELFGEEDASALSPEAREILENSRSASEARDELTLLADNATSSSGASATSAETSDSEAGRLGEVNRKLQLAREELSSTRLQTGDLEEQVAELDSTTENLDALVTLRQTGVAQLEAQLADAKNSGADVDDVVQGVLSGIDEIAEGTVDAGANAVDAAGNLIDSGADAASGAVDSTAEFVDSGANALTDAGVELGDVELFEEEPVVDGGQSNEAAQPFQTTPPAEPTVWYQDLLAQPQKLAIAGVGLLAALGVAGTLLWRRRRNDDDVEEVGFGEDVDFIDEDEAAELQGDITRHGFDDVDEFDDFGEVGSGTVAAAAAATAGAGAVAASSFDDFDEEVSTQNFDASAAFDADGEADLTNLDFGAESDDSEEALDKDDTISEADVYLAYGLHGQAEELLNKAIEKNPNQQEYTEKLLQTYHAQGNGDGFVDAAKNFHARFGGEMNPEWAGIAAMGAELKPDEPLFESAGSEVASMGSDFTTDAGKLTEDDFLPASDLDESMGAVNRSIDASNIEDDLPELDVAAEDNGGFDLGAPAAAVGAAATAAVATGAAAFTSAKDSVSDAVSDSLDFDVDETELMDQSLDPAFAFDEADLEATGDFSQIADELAEEAGDGIDFASFDDTLAVDTSGGLLDDTVADEDGLGAALTMDELDDVIGTADDLTLDLDQLSGDLELDSAELMNSDLSDIDLPDLSMGNELDADDLTAQSASNDEDAMETMLDLAKAYIDMGDKDSASSALDEIVKSGNPAQVTEAETLLRKIS